jgi:transcriptional regulator with XRE-family HTH domain
MKTNSMPSADKLATIADYLEVSTDYLLGLTDDPTPPKKHLTDEERLAAEIFKMSPEKREQLIQYATFLKIQADSSKELSEKLKLSVREPLPE